MHCNVRLECCRQVAARCGAARRCSVRLQRWLTGGCIVADMKCAAMCGCSAGGLHVSLLHYVAVRLHGPKH